MASPFGHAVVAATFAVAWRPRSLPVRVGLLGILCAELPDIDVVGFWFGIPYEHVLGHRGFTHSLLFAVLFSAALVMVPPPVKEPAMSRGMLWIYFILTTVSHGMLDAFTNGGLGVAFFAPFENRRYFFPFRPIVVSPLEWDHFFTRRGIEVLWSEFVWIDVPCALIVGLAFLNRRR